MHELLRKFAVFLLLPFIVGKMMTPFDDNAFMGNIRYCSFKYIFVPFRFLPFSFKIAFQKTHSNFQILYLIFGISYIVKG